MLEIVCFRREEECGPDMGFGSYDESEQQNQAVDSDEENGEEINVHENDYEGEMKVESDMSTDDLLDRLNEMKNDSDGDR